VIVSGTYVDVQSAIDVLNTYPPLKKDFDEIKKRAYFPLYGPGSNPTPSNVPTIGVKKDGKRLLLFDGKDNKTYSGSGSLIMVIGTNDKNLSNAKFIFFRKNSSSNDKEYFEAGGMIDEPKPNEQITDINEFLFKNAQKETEEESLRLFKLTQKSPKTVDIESSVNKTIYRVYFYLIRQDNPNDLITKYSENKRKILEDYSNNYNESYKETDDLKLFGYTSFVNTLNTTYGSFVGREYPNSEFQSDDGFYKVKGRTIKVVSEFVKKNTFTGINLSTDISSTNNTVTTDTNINIINVL